MQKVLFIAGLLVLGLVFTHQREVTHGPGVLAPDNPVQVNLEGAANIPFKEVRVIPQATFEITARVLSKEKYWSGPESDLSPIDLALGWGPMSDTAVLDEIDIWQSGRWYRWKSKDLPITQPDVSNHSANMHMIPATDAIEKQLKRLKKGEIVSIIGKLVNIETDEGWHWNSSMTRGDRGGGACEVVFVESVTVVEVANSIFE